MNEKESNYTGIQEFSAKVEKVYLYDSSPNYLPLIIINNLKNINKDEIISYNTFILYNETLLSLGQLKKGDLIYFKSEIIPKKINGIFGYELSDVDFSKMLNNRINKKLPDDLDTFIGKILFENRNKYYAKDGYEKFAYKYIDWKKTNNNSKTISNKNTKVPENSYSGKLFKLGINKRFTFEAKFTRIDLYINKSNKITPKILFHAIKCKNNNQQINGKTILNYAKSFRELGSLYKNDVVVFDAKIVEKSEFWNSKYHKKYDLQRPTKIKLLNTNNKERKIVPFNDDELLIKIQSNKLYLGKTSRIIKTKGTRKNKYHKNYYKYKR